MREELDLLSELVGRRRAGLSTSVTFTASFLTTYTAYLPFYEDVVLRRLLAAGCRYNVLLLDSRAFAESVARPTTRPRLAGRAYTLVPMRARGIFHPKLALLVGERHSRVIVGSHNMTVAGFGYNRELSTIVDLVTAQDGPEAALAQEVWSCVAAWLRQQTRHVPPSVLDAALQVATRGAPWLRDRTAQTGALRFVGTSPEGDSLWARVRPLLPARARHIVVLGAFFDQVWGFLHTLLQQMDPAMVHVGIEPETVELMGMPPIPERVRFVDVTSLGRGTGYLHAKALWIEGEDGETVLITGSANPSGQAWTATPASRNVEGVLVHLGTAARELVEQLEITAILDLPTLRPTQWEAITARMSRSHWDAASRSIPHAAIAEARDDGIFLPLPRPERPAVRAVRCLHQAQEDVMHAPYEVRDEAAGLLIALAPAQIDATAFLEIDFADSSSLRALVHHPSSIARLSRTSTQQKFSEALDSLDGESPDLPTVLRLANQLIFADDTPQRTETRLTPSGAATADHGESAVHVLAVSIADTPRDQRRARLVPSSDLACILDMLIYHLGVGLRSVAEQLADSSLSEEEQVGREEDRPSRTALLPDVDIVQVCHSKIRLLVSRMLKQLTTVKDQGGRAYHLVVQLLAVLAVLREVRAYDHRLTTQTSDQSLVPCEQRRRLFNGALAALFGRHQRLYETAAPLLAEAPDNDLSRLMGLLLWLAWDCGLDARQAAGVVWRTPDEAHRPMQDLAQLLELARRGANDAAALEEAQRCIRRTAGGTAQGSADRWLACHNAWGHALATLLATRESWGQLGCPPSQGDLGWAVKEDPPTLRVILSANNETVGLAELGEPRGAVKFRRNFVAVTGMPSLAY